MLRKDEQGRQSRWQHSSPGRCQAHRFSQRCVFTIEEGETIFDCLKESPQGGCSGCRLKPGAPFAIG